MTPIVELDPDFAFQGTAEAAGALVAQPALQPADPLGPLTELPGPGTLAGTWVGHGFNTIWRPHRASTGQDRFLELNRTDEKLVFTRINGPIPNRGLAMPDIDMFGVTYLQQINEAGHPTQGLHIEPGIWAHVPQTSDPTEPPTVVRMASIPHGTVILAQGIFQPVPGGPQIIPDNNILPFFFGSPPPANGAFHSVAQTFPELDLSIPTQFRSLSPGVTQDMIKNPNLVLQEALANSLQGTTMKSRTFLHVSTTGQLIKGGGGTANTAFLASSHNPPGGNARSAHVEATFWIETIAGTGGNPDTHQLQYTQLVMLDFNGIHWPHVTVGTLRKQ
ncbi:MAG: heme-binding protein [Actinomycetota bacterium]|nr:heme-binding protein [Actinomycetota bacterium]